MREHWGYLWKPEKEGSELQSETQKHPGQVWPNLESASGCDRDLA